jgi:serine/threonine protein kinase
MFALGGCPPVIGLDLREGVAVPGPIEPLRRSDPERIGPYTLLGRLGAGSMGQVFLARSPAGRLVAVKTIRVELAEEPGFRARFAREVAAAKRVSGVFTAAVIEADPDADLPWVATAYVPAPSLSRLVRRCGPLPVPAVRWLAAGCAEALQSIHGAGLLHRDIKPSNVLVAPDGPRVIDFGVSMRAERMDLTNARGAVGTPEYMAPEQARDATQASPASDVFSLGATLVFAATGHPPYQGDTVMDILVRLATEPPDLSGVPDELADLATACLRRVPRERPTNKAILEELSPFADQSGNEHGYLPDSALAVIAEYQRVLAGGVPARVGTVDDDADDDGGTLGDDHDGGTQGSLTPLPGFDSLAEGAPDLLADLSADLIAQENIAQEGEAADKPANPAAASAPDARQAGAPLQPRADPRTVGAFRLLRRLSMGGQGQVYLGESPTGQLVAVKILHPHNVDDPQFRARFKREVQAARLVSPAYTAAVVDADPGADPPWLATTYIPGPTLDKVVRDSGPLTGPEVRRLGAVLAEGLTDIHACGLVHRDLKPGNIIMADNGPRIIDFGIARAVGAPTLTDSGDFFGTYPYMAPERFHGTAGTASDVFSLGAVLAHAATGRSPFEAPSPAETMRRILEMPPDLDAIPEPLRTLVAACLEKDPARRPAPRDLLKEFGAMSAAERQTAVGGTDGKAVTVDRSAGIQVGDGNIQNNFFYGEGHENARPARRPGDGSPYRGRDAFTEEDQEIFFGRDDAIEAVMERLSSGDAGLVIIAGAAGVGKSSLLHAGILPLLSPHRVTGAPGAQYWPWPRVLFTPGNAPLDELAAQVAAVAGGVSANEVRQSLAADPGRLGLLARQAVITRLGSTAHARDARAQPRLLMVIDQFEQVFTMCRDEGQRRAFIDALHGAATESAALVLLAVRAHHVSQCAEYPQLADAVAARYQLEPMTEHELALAITGPASWAGVQVNSALVFQLLADVRGRPDALPLLSHALAESWKGHTGDVLALADYDRIAPRLTPNSAGVPSVEERQDNQDNQDPPQKAEQQAEEQGTQRHLELEELRTLVAAGQYPEAEALLARLAAADPQGTEHARREFGFVTLPAPDRQVIATAWRATAAGHDVSELLADSEEARPGLLETSPETPAPAKQPAATPPRPAQQEDGTALEQAAIDLFQRFFAVDPDQLIEALRGHGTGTRFGHDLMLECETTGSPAVRCHVEWQNLARHVTVNDIAGKLAQQEFRHRDAQVDHWILISPHQDVSDELRLMLGAWEEQDKHPFSVQVWSPDSGVRELLALEPAVFHAVYGRQPTEEEDSASMLAAARFKDRLSPRLRIDPIWRRYVGTPRSFCFVNEDFQHFAALYDSHLALKATDDRGALLDGTLMDQVTAWARKGGGSPMLLLADFGEGKSVFTYCLTRRLSDEFRTAADDPILPLRIPLREFRDAGSARDLLLRRLDEVGATLADWRRLTGQVRTLAILDGFDEMSADLSPSAVTANLSGVTACLTELSGSKVLVTSRQRVLDGTRDWNRTLDRLRRPLIMRVGSGSRRQRVQYLEQFATDEASARVLAKLRSLYDPIGLAAKPLFLEMIKETLRDLPADTFSETILYDTYIDKSLRNKPELLHDPDELLTSDELVENLKDILADIAVRLQEANAAYLYLRDYQRKGDGKIAELLWKMRDQAAPREPFKLAAQDDAANRVGIRSLLKAVPAPRADQWPVDFFHRSMREYFVARAIVHALSADPERARRLLRPAPLLPEVTHFAATIMRERPDPRVLDTLDAMARSARVGLAVDPGYVGGNALTLLYAVRGDLPHGDWSGLRLHRGTRGTAATADAALQERPLRRCPHRARAGQASRVRAALTTAVRRQGRRPAG